MSKALKQYVAFFLLALFVGVLAWRLWPDDGQARRQQRNRELISAVVSNRLADTTRLLDEGADPNAQTRPPKIAGKVEAYYFFVSHKMKAPDWRHMDALNPRLSVLEIAAMHGNVDMVSLLLSRGADIGYQDKAKNTALNLAELRKVIMPPAAWKSSSYPRVIVLLKAAEARRRPPSPQ